MRRGKTTNKAYSIENLKKAPSTLIMNSEKDFTEITNES